MRHSNDLEILHRLKGYTALPVAGWRKDKTTVQAPHPPSPQPIFVEATPSTTQGMEAQIEQMPKPKFFPVVHWKIWGAKSECGEVTACSRWQTSWSTATPTTSIPHQQPLQQPLSSAYQPTVAVTVISIPTVAVTSSQINSYSKHINLSPSTKWTSTLLWKDFRQNTSLEVFTYLYEDSGLAICQAWHPSELFVRH